MSLWFPTVLRTKNLNELLWCCSNLLNMTALIDSDNKAVKTGSFRCSYSGLST